MRRSWLIGAVAAASVLCWPAGALASVTPGWECVPTTVGQPVLSGGTGSSPSCSSGTPVLAPTYTGSGVGGQPTVVFSGLNVQIVDGLAATSAVNGTGNLVLGYDENPSGRKQTGSHDLIVGEDNGYTSYGQLVAGYDDQVTDSYATAIGLGNLASGYASLAAGHGNTASGSESTVAGGQSNHASGPESSIAGGAFNTAGGTYGVVAGGCSNLAGSGTVTVNADCKSTKTFAGDFASVTGGAGNQATAIDSAVSGGAFNTAAAGFGAVAGGCSNLDGGGSVNFNVDCNDTSFGVDFSTVTGGDGNQADGLDGAVTGGQENTASGTESAVSGGADNVAGVGLTAILGGLDENLSTFEDSQAGSTVFSP